MIKSLIQKKYYKHQNIKKYLFVNIYIIVLRYNNLCKILNHLIIKYFNTLN